MFDINNVIAGMVPLTMFALILDIVAGWAERRLMAWPPKSGETERI